MTARKTWKKTDNIHPDDEDWVLLYDGENKEAYIGYYDTERDAYFCKDTGVRLYKVTHWMNIPEL